MTGTTASLLTIFGATGDLARRMLLPSLHGLERDGLLPSTLRVLGTARSALDTDGFRALVAEAIEEQVPASERDPDALAALLQRIQYQPAALDDASSLASLCDTISRLRDGGDAVFHLSTAPRWYDPVCDALAAHGVAGPGTRVMLEKPLGHDLASATAINDGVARVFDEDRVFRVDHYLGKEGVQNLLALRFGNALFEPLWNARHVEQVQITVAETVGVEGRGDYYDESGASRDMLQNHLLQLLCLVAIEPPSQFEPTAVRNEKIKVLRSLRPIGREEVAAETVIGQYTAGAVGGLAVPGYLDELGRGSATATFVALRAQVDNWRWKGVPFYLRTGKRMPQRKSEVLIQFKPVPHNIFARVGAGKLNANSMIINLQPEENIRVKVMAKQPGLDREGVKLKEVTMDVSLSHSFAGERRRIAYERLLLDFIEGDQTLFVRRDEVEAQWAWIDAIRAQWASEALTPKPYAAGSWGPSAAIALAERDGVSWHE